MAVSQAISQLQQASTEAVATLRAIMDDEQVVALHNKSAGHLQNKRTEGSV
jgi:hypothetical protein